MEVRYRPPAVHDDGHYGRAGDRDDLTMRDFDATLRLSGRTRG
jgi:hypothetical protein